MGVNTDSSGLLAWGTTRMELPFLGLGKISLDWGEGNQGYYIDTELQMPLLQLNSDDEKGDPYMSSRVQWWLWARIKNLKLTALKMYLSP